MPSLRTEHESPNFFECLFAKHSKFAVSLRFLQCVKWDVIVIITYEIARPVTSVMTDIKRFQAFRHLCQLLLRTTVCQIVACGETDIVFYLLLGCLGKDAACQEQGRNE